MAGRIAGITIEIDGNTTKLTKALEDTNKSIKNTQTQLKDVERLLKLDPTNINLLKQRQEALTKAIADTKSKLDTLKNAQKQMDSNGVDKSSKEYQALQREIVATEQELKNLEKTARESNATLQKISAVGEKLKDVGGKITDVGKDLTTHVTLPLAAVGAAGVKSFAEVDKTMQLTNKTMGNTAEEAELLNQAMKDAASASTYGMSDAANATLNFARAGLDAEQAAGALAPAMNLAAGEGGNLDTVSAGLVATINGFHGSFEEAGAYADVFAAACNNSALDVDSLSNSMSVAAPVFSAAGYSVNDAALYMGVMANNGIEADKAANSLKTGISRLVAPAKEGADMMKQLGIEVTNSDGSMKDSVVIQQELHDAFANLSESEQIAAASAIFGKNQMAPWLALINTAPTDVDALNTSLSTCAGTTEEMADAMMSGFGGSIEQLKSGIDVLITSIGEALAPTLQKVIDFIQNLVDKFNALTPAQQQTIVTIGLIVAAIGPALVAIGNVITAVGTIMTIVPKVSGVISALNAILLANPIALVVAAIAALVAAFIYLWNNCEGFREFWINLWNKIKEIAKSVGDWLKGAIEDIGGFFTGLGDKAREMKDAVVNKWNDMNQNVSEKVDAIKQNVSDKWNSMKTAISEKTEAIRSSVSEKWNNIKSAVTEKVSSIKSDVASKFDAIKSSVTEKMQAARTAVAEKLNNIKSAFQQNGGGLKGIASATMEAVKSYFSLGYSAINSLTGGRLGEIVNAFQSKLSTLKEKASSIINNVRDKFSEGLNKIKSLFSGLKLELPKIKLPHFSITGKLSLDPPSVPHLSVSWYAKAMNNAMLLNGATIFGAMGGKLLGGGEKGQEVVAGANTLMRMMQQALQSTLNVNAAAPMNGTIRHSGTIRIEGVNDHGEFVAAGNAVLDNIGIGELTHLVMEEMYAATERKAAVY